MFDLSTVRVPTGGGVTDENDDDPWNPGDDVLPNNDRVLSPEILSKDIFELETLPLNLYFFSFYQPGKKVSFFELEINN